MGNGRGWPVWWAGYGYVVCVLRWLWETRGIYWCIAMVVRDPGYILVYCDDWWARWDKAAQAARAREQRRELRSWAPQTQTQARHNQRKSFTIPTYVLLNGLPRKDGWSSLWIIYCFDKKFVIFHITVHRVRSLSSKYESKFPNPNFLGWCCHNNHMGHINWACIERSLEYDIF